MTVPADPGRFYLRLPCLVLAAVMAGAVILPPVAGLVRPGGFAAVLPGCVQALLMAGAMLFYVRVVYAGRTQLTLDAAGLELRQPFAAWRVRWDEVSAVTVTSPWDATHKGGIAAGVRLRLADGGTRHIPDVLLVPRRDLARLIEGRGAPPALPAGRVGSGTAT